LGVLARLTNLFPFIVESVCVWGQAKVIKYLAGANLSLRGKGVGKGSVQEKRNYFFLALDIPKLMYEPWGR